MKFVLDSSVTFKWVVSESDTPRAVRLRDEFRAAVHELIAPDVFPPELAHALKRTSNSYSTRCHGELGLPWRLVVR